MSEECDRCNSVGEDRRTLWMACFYEMSELGLPFLQEILFHADVTDLEKVSDPVVFEAKSGERITLGSGTVKSKGELIPQKLFTLRVCKRCRGEWMQCLVDWFHKTPEGRDYDADERIESLEVGGGIFLRDKGSIKEITREEWDHL